MKRDHLTVIPLYIHEKQYTVSHKKQDTKLLSTTLPNIERFSKFFHFYTQQEIKNKKRLLKISPQLKSVATLPCEILISES